MTGQQDARIDAGLDAYEATLLQDVDLDALRKQYDARPMIERWRFTLPADAARVALLAAGTGMREPFTTYPVVIDMPGGLGQVAITAHTLCAVARKMEPQFVNDYAAYREVFSDAYATGYEIGLFLLKGDEPEARAKAIQTIRLLNPWQSLAMCIATLKNGMQGHGITNPADFLAILQKETARTV